MIALIDGDNIPYVIGWLYRDVGTPEEVEHSTGQYIDELLLLSGADRYIGVFSAIRNFRKTAYKYAAYKGTRAEKPDWYRKWCPVIEKYLAKEWGFTRPSLDLEADDVVSMYAEQCRERDVDHIMVSPDKDLDQIPGKHFNHRDTATERWDISPEDAERFLWTQVLMGDTTDNVKGVPGMGIVKATKLLVESPPVTHRLMVKQQYQKYFGDYYGNIIFNETLAAIMLMCTRHPMIHDFRANWDPMLNVKSFNSLGKSASSMFDTQ